MSWPVRPKGQDEHSWYREVEQRIVLTVVNADPQDSICGECGVRRVIYQAQLFPERSIVARCKDCLLSLAGGEDRLWVRTGSLRETWQRDGRNQQRTAAATEAKKARRQRQNEAEARSDAIQEG